MSQTNANLEKYRGTAGAEVKTTNISSDDHALKKELGNDDKAKERKYDSKIAGERFVQFYDDTAAGLREYLSNAETAGIRRARQSLLNNGFSEDEIPDEITELLKMAKEEADYEPVIEVTYNRKPDETRLIIEDNGIGISVEEYQVVQRIGYSTSHHAGGRLGSFGMGWMSGFQLTGINGMFKMYTKSYLTDEAYGTVEYVANFEYLDIVPTEYGTRFEFPAFGEAAKQINIPKKIEEFTEGMVVPVIYRDFDKSGKETSKSDDFLATRIEDDYADDSLVVTAEEEFFKAVMSPDPKEVGRGLTTYNISMPIRRNCDKFGRNPKFDAPWKWDFRAKREDGPIVSCPSDESLVGLIPKENKKYDKLFPEMQEKCIPMSELPDDAIVMPEPASSRDSFMSGHDDFWQYVSVKLKEAWAEVASERFEQLKSWDDFLDMSLEEKNGLFRAYSSFGPSTTDNDPDTVQETLEENVGVTVPLGVCKKLDASRRKVSVVQRGSNRAHTKGATNRKKIWKVIDEAPDGIYMGRSISQKKAEIVWGLGETHVVRLGKKETYREHQDMWDWKKAKDLPHRNLKEKLPELDDDVAEKFENVSDNQSNNTRRSTTGGDGKNPEVYRGKVRVGSNSKKYFSTWKMDDLVEKLSNDNTFRAGRYSCKYLIICKDDETARSTGEKADKRKKVAAMRLPKYVYDYMIDQPNVYESMDDIKEDNGGVDIELSDGTKMNIIDLPETDCLLKTPTRIKNNFETREDDLVELLGYDSSEFDRSTWVNRYDFEGAWKVGTDATVVKISGSSNFKDFSDYDYHTKGYKDLLMEDRLGDVDKSSEEYELLFGYRYGEPSGSDFEKLLEIAERAGLPKKDNSGS